MYVKLVPNNVCYCVQCTLMPDQTQTIRFMC